MEKLSFNREFRRSKLGIKTARLSANKVIPAEIDALIDNKAYYNKFHKLIREGNIEKLLLLAEKAKVKRYPSHWFARVTSKRQWNFTVSRLRVADNVSALASRIADKLGATGDTMLPIYSAIWKLGMVAERLAVNASENGKHKYKYFNYLVGLELKKSA